VCAIARPARAAGALSEEHDSMQKVKPWQIVLFVLAAAAVGVSVFMVLRGDRPKLSHEVFLVDISTGEMFSIDPSGKSIPVPAKSPSTGKRDLYPVGKNEDGRWQVEFRALGGIQQSRADSAPAIDVETGLVVDAGEIRRISTRDLLNALKAAQPG
jgi:hypothetical protein